jgi:hypothetical protein
MVQVAVCDMRVVGSFFVMAAGVMFGSLVVVLGRMLVMLSRLCMMVCCLLGHASFLHDV